MCGKKDQEKQILKEKFTLISQNAEYLTEKELDMKNIRKRTDGRWEYRKNINGNNISLIANTQKELKEKIKGIKLPAKQPQIITLTLGDWAKKWYLTYKKHTLRPKSQLEYKNTIDNHIYKFFKDIPIKKVTTLQVQKFINEEVKGEQVKNKVFQHIVNILKSAVANNLLSKDLTIGLVKPKRTNINVRLPLTIEEQKLFLNEIKNTEIEKFCKMCLVLGTRRQEALNFCINDINESKNTIHIKGTKTSNANRIIKISNSMINFLKKNITNINQRVYACNEKTIYDKIKKVLIKIGLKNYSIHNLRHTCATNLYYLGMRDNHRKHQMGHGSIVVTNDIYTHIDPDIKAKNIKKLYGNLYYEFKE